MASPLENCTLEEQRYVFRFLVAEDIRASHIFPTMSKSYMNLLKVGWSA